MTRLNKRGMTLIEVLVVLIILGIIIPLLGNLFVGMNRYIVKASKTIQTLQATIADAKATELTCTAACVPKAVNCTGVVFKRRGNSDNYEMVEGSCSTN